METPFKITDMLPQFDTSAKAKENRQISYYDLVPSADNFYSMQDIDELKAAIELAGRVLHNLVVVPQGNGKYTILSGHRRHRAIGELLNEGKDQYEFLPCSVVDDESDLSQQTVLIAANSQREKTAWDKLEEVKQMREIARKAKEQRGISGRVRDLVAKSLNVSNSRIAKYDSILNNLIPALMDEIKVDKLSISVAYELSTLAANRQLASYEYYLNHGKLPDKPARSQPIAVQTDEVEPPQPDVFHRNTQPVAVQTDEVEPPQSDVFHRNTQPQAVQSDTAHYQIDVMQLTNNEKRKAVLAAWQEWPLWATVPEIGLTVHRLDLPDGSAFTASWYDGDDFYPGGGTRNLNRPRYHLIGAGDKLASGSQAESILIDHLQAMRQKRMIDANETN
ncbi:ParB/RepB/Spo0J family partition protein [Agathobaculum sp. Marseille-P7918]|uniref:ParB/RepB/Spo0J family partition protein n=1 Tax=Agathobaculum sp. Marseille-P7918 TaxID=2479843 RepID=UPI0035687D27